MIDGLQGGRAPDGVGSGAVPGLRRLLVETGPGVVVGEDLGLGRRDLGSAGQQDLGDPAVVLLPRATQQGLVGGVLDERVLEDVAGTRWPAALIQELVLHELL